MPRSKDSSITEGKVQAELGTDLKEEVKEALRAVLRDPGASAAAKASAGRTLLEHFAGGDASAARMPSEMTLQDIDSEIARLTAAKN